MKTIFWIVVCSLSIFAEAAQIRSRPTTISVAVPGTLSNMAQVARQMAPGEWRELTTFGFDNGAILLPNYAGSADSPIIEFSDEAMWSSAKRKVLIMGCARGNIGPGDTGAYRCGNSASEDAGFVEYDEATNSWKRNLNSPVNTASHAYDGAAINSTSGEFYYIESSQSTAAKVWKSSADGVWSNLPYPNAYNFTANLEYFPDMNALVNIAGGSDASGDENALIYSFSTSTWSSRKINFPIGNYSIFSEYSAPRKLLYFGGGEYSATANVLVRMDAQGNMARCTDAPTPLGIAGGSGRMSVDPVTGNLLVFATAVKGDPLGEGPIWSYDPSKEGTGTSPWKIVGRNPLSFTYDGDTFSQISVFTPIPEYGVIFVAKFGGGSKIYLYKPAQ